MASASAGRRSLRCSTPASSSPRGSENTLLSVAETELYRVRWTEEILSETRRAILREVSGIDPVRLDRMLADMREAFPDAVVEGYEQLVPSMTNHEGDRHVLAAAVESDAQVIVTSNLRHFPPEACEPHHIAVQEPDEFLDYAFELDPERVIAAVAYQAAKRGIQPRPSASCSTCSPLGDCPTSPPASEPTSATSTLERPGSSSLPLEGVGIGSDLGA